MSYNYQEHDNQVTAFEHLWRDYLSTYPPMDKMTSEEAAKFKEYALKVYLMGKHGRPSY
jgi:hypothetical protein